MITSIFSPPPTTWISRGSTASFVLVLPACSVVSDPCEEHVAAKLSLHTKDGHGLELETPERSYTFVADPNASFAENGDRGSRPIVIARGEIERTIPPKRNRPYLSFPKRRCDDGLGKFRPRSDRPNICRSKPGGRDGVARYTGRDRVSALGHRHDGRGLRRRGISRRESRVWRTGYDPSPTLRAVLWRCFFNAVEIDRCGTTGSDASRSLCWGRRYRTGATQFRSSNRGGGIDHDSRLSIDVRFHAR